MTYETFSNDVITFVGGSYQVISFNIYNLGGDRVISPIIDNVVWDMALYGENESLLHKTMNDKEITVDKGTINIVLKEKIQHLFLDYLHINLKLQMLIMKILLLI